MSTLQNGDEVYVNKPGLREHGSQGTVVFVSDTGLRTVILHREHAPFRGQYEADELVQDKRLLDDIRG